MTIFWPQFFLLCLLFLLVLRHAAIIYADDRTIMEALLKRLSEKRMESGLMGTKGITEFQAEISVLTDVSHRNLVTLLDVFAFGVILMEIITARKSLDESLPDNRSHLVTWLRRVIVNKENFQGEIDKSLDLDHETCASIYKVAKLAGHCTSREPSQRPDMSHAVNVLTPLVWKPASYDEEDIDDDYVLIQK